MSGNLGLKIGLSEYNWQGSVPVFRYAFGLALVCGVAMISAHLLAYLTPVLAINLFNPGSKPVGVKSAFFLIVSLFIANLGGMNFSKLFLSTPVVFILLFGLSLFFIYYLNSLNIILKLWLIVSLLLIPFLSSFMPQIAVAISIGLMLNLGIAILCSWVIFAIFPDHRKLESSAKQKKTGLPLLSPGLTAFRSVLVVLPIVIIFYSYQLSGSILIMVFVVILSMNPQTANLKAGGIMIIANILGGLLAIIAYQLICVFPNVIFIMLLTALVGLYCGKHLFSNDPKGAIYGSAFSTYLLVLGSVLSAESGDAGEKTWDRIIQISIAILYVVSAFAFLNEFFFSKYMKSEQS
ncbi:MAG TPA: hypothetical protein DCX54_07450 [Flavobacteriales bacterium]|nr:hypothetical protein [Flavobacteriales bacterium]